MMIDHDLNLAKREKLLIEEGYLEPTWDNSTAF
jgi:hypothetical protein